MSSFVVMQLKKVLQLAKRCLYFWFFRGMIDFYFFYYSILNNFPNHFNNAIINLTNESRGIKDENRLGIVSTIIGVRDFGYQKFNSDLVY